MLDAGASVKRSKAFSKVIVEFKEGLAVKSLDADPAWILTAFFSHCLSQLPSH